MASRHAVLELARSELPLVKPFDNFCQADDEVSLVENDLDRVHREPSIRIETGEKVNGTAIGRSTFGSNLSHTWQNHRRQGPDSYRRRRRFRGPARRPTPTPGPPLSS